MQPIRFAFQFPLLLVAIAAQEAPPPDAPKAIEAITKERLDKAYADARAACKEVLGAELEALPPLQIVAAADLATVIADENLPVVLLRQSDPDKARAEAASLGQQIAAIAYAKYAWSTKTFLVVAKTWEANAKVLERPELTADNTLRAVMVHELCHAIDDGKFDLGKRLLDAKTVDSATAFNCVLEGHAQLVTRRVCAVRGWSDGFETFTSSIGALPKYFRAAGEGVAMLHRATAAVMQTAYVDGEAFAKAVIDARPESGRVDLFTKPPQDAETILQPQWYLDPKTRPAVLHDFEPAIDAFVAKFDDAIWSANRSSPTPKQLASGLTLLPKADVDAMVGTLRAVRMVQLAPTAAPQSKIAILAVMEFDSEESAQRWVALSGVLSDKKDVAMRKGAMRITASKTTKLEDEPVRGLLQEKAMQVGKNAFDVASLDAWHGRCVVETIYSGEPPAREQHVEIVAAVIAAIAKKK